MIGILADSHDHVLRLKQAAHLFRETKCSLVIHAGDIIAPFSARELAGVGCPLRAVFGNCDGEKPGLVRAVHDFGLIEDAPFAFTHAGISFLVSHLDAPVKSYLERRKHRVVVFGHTHKPEVRREGETLVINPGECGGWLSGKSTVALLDPENLEVEIISL